MTASENAPKKRTRTSSRVEPEKTESKAKKEDVKSTESDKENEDVAEGDHLLEKGKNIGTRNTSIAAEDTVGEKSSVSKREAKDDDLVTIRGRVADEQIAFVEVHQLHPGGQVILIGKNEAKVWPTSKYREALRRGSIEIVG